MLSCLPLVTYQVYLNLNRGLCLICLAHCHISHAHCSFLFRKHSCFSFHFPLSKSIYHVSVICSTSLFELLSLHYENSRIYSFNIHVLCSLALFFLLLCLFILICFLLVDSMQVFGFNMKHRHIIEVFGS
jgi:presenilin-like A22 family membrane protease